MDETQIVSLFFARDESAIAAVRDHYGNYCARIAGNILDSPEDVEEVLSDTWFRAWNTIPPQNPHSLKLYLARITRNLAFDRFRTQTRGKRGGAETTVALHELLECIPSPDQPEQQLEARELEQAVNRFLAALPFRDRRVFLLRYFHLESTEAIAVRCGIRSGLVRTILSRTRKKLKTCLEKEGLIT